MEFAAPRKAGINAPGDKLRSGKVAIDIDCWNGTPSGAEGNIVTPQRRWHGFSTRGIKTAALVVSIGIAVGTVFTLSAQSDTA